MKTVDAEKVKKELKFSIRNDSYMDFDEKQMVELDRIIDAVIAFVPTKRYVLEGFVRNYYSPRKQVEGHSTYRGMLHHLKTDKHLKVHEFLNRILADKVPEGNSVRIIVEDTGERAEKADTQWVLVRPHHYGPETEAEDGETVS